VNPGTVYLFGNYTRNADDVELFEFPIEVSAIDSDQKIAYIWADIDGYCTRTVSPDLGDGTSSNGYCHFTYTIYDAENGGFEIGAFVAEGAIRSRLLIKGGTMELMGVTGLVDIMPAQLDMDFTPPLLENNLGDVFDSADGYLHSIDLRLSPSVFESSGQGFLSLEKSS
jgi:hypothetical protein